MLHFTITLLILMAWVSQGQGQEVSPAKIYLMSNRSKLELKCSTHGLKQASEKNVFIYLCKNGVGIDVKSSCQDATFFVDNNTKDNTGNYSCVFSVKQYDPRTVKGNGSNFFFITVNDSFIPAEIALPQTSVQTGLDVEFQCTALKLPERNQNGYVYAYLYKNGTVIQMNIWDKTKNEARFTLKEVMMQDAGTYICFLMSEPCPFPKNVHGINEVNLYVTEETNETVTIIVSGFSLLLIIILCLGFWGMFRKQGCCKCHRDRSAEHDLSNTEMDQGKMQNEQSFGSEWDNSSDNAHASEEEVYEVYQNP